MKVKKITPVLRQLNNEELKDINGGATNSVSMTMNSSADSLLSIEFKWQQGNNYQDYKISAGNDINAGLNAWSNNKSNT